MRPDGRWRAKKDDRMWIRKGVGVNFRIALAVGDGNRAASRSFHRPQNDRVVANNVVSTALDNRGLVPAPPVGFSPDQQIILDHIVLSIDANRAISSGDLEAIDGDVIAIEVKRSIVNRTTFNPGTGRR